MGWFRGSALAAMAATALAAPSAQAAPAPGAPGALSHFDLARKDCVGTARNTTSRVWFTVANGVLSDVYEPNVDTTNVETMQFIVTDGKSFTDLQSRDMTYSVDADPTGMVCTVTSKARNYTLTDDLLHRSRARHGAGQDRPGGQGRPEALRAAGPDRRRPRRRRGRQRGRGLRHRGQGRARRGRPDDRDRGGQPRLREADLPRAAGRQALHQGERGLRADRQRRAHPARHRPQADRVRQRAERQRRPHRGAAQAGHARARVRPHRRPGPAHGRSQPRTRRTCSRSGATCSSGRSTTPGSSARASSAPPATTSASTSSRPPRTRSSRGRSPPGSPRRGARPSPPATCQDGKAPYFGSYREVFCRDLYEATTALLVAGDVDTVRDSARFLLERQQLADGRIPRNSLLNGKVAPDTGGDQLDETAFPILMAYQSGLQGDRDLYTDHIRKAADFLVARGPSFGNERWEEQGGYSPSTIAAEIAGPRRRRQDRRRPSTTTTARSSTWPPPTTSSARSRAGR